MEECAEEMILLKKRRRRRRRIGRPPKKKMGRPKKPKLKHIGPKMRCRDCRKWKWRCPYDKRSRYSTITTWHCGINDPTVHAYTDDNPRCISCNAIHNRTIKMPSEKQRRTKQAFLLHKLVKDVANMRFEINMLKANFERFEMTASRNGIVFNYAKPTTIQQPIQQPSSPPQLTLIEQEQQEQEQEQEQQEQHPSAAYMTRAEKEEYIVKLYKENLGIREISKIVHMSFSNISPLIRQAKLEIEQEKLERYRRQRQQEQEQEQQQQQQQTEQQTAEDIVAKQIENALILSDAETETATATAEAEEVKPEESPLTISIGDLPILPLSADRNCDFCGRTPKEFADWRRIRIPKKSSDDGSDNVAIVCQYCLEEADQQQ